MGEVERKYIVQFEVHGRNGVFGIQFDTYEEAEKEFNSVQESSNYDSRATFKNVRTLYGESFRLFDVVGSKIRKLVIVERELGFAYPYVIKVNSSLRKATNDGWMLVDTVVTQGDVSVNVSRLELLKSGDIVLLLTSEEYDLLYGALNGEKENQHVSYFTGEMLYRAL